MKGFLGIVMRAVLVALSAAAVGLGVNLISPGAIPYVYVPPPVIVIMGVEIPLIDEKKAYSYIDDERTVFVDARDAHEFEEGHVRGAVKLPASEKEELYSVVEPLFPEKPRFILYCHGPDCKMAEKVAELLIQLDHKDMMIMEAGFFAWEKAGYPVESDGRPKSGGSK